jgi:hypothetical protein
MVKIITTLLLVGLSCVVSSVELQPPQNLKIESDVRELITNRISLLTLITPDAFNHLTSKGLFQEWTNQISKEKVFSFKYRVVEPVLKTNNIFASNRFSKAIELNNIIESESPQAVQIIGGLAIPATGSDVADGHPGCQQGGVFNGKFIPGSGRVTYVDWPYTGQIPWSYLTDRFNFETNFCDIYGNKAGDGRYDQSGLPPYSKTVWFKNSSNEWVWVSTNTLPSGMGKTKRIVTRLDFSGIDPWPNPATAARVPTNFWSAGELVWPKRDEMLDYENYFIWNLKYRKNEWNPTPDVWAYSEIWGLYPTGKRHLTNIVGNQLNIIVNQDIRSIAGYEPYMVWNGLEPNAWYYWERITDGKPLKTVWLNTYKSYVYEYNNRLGMRSYVAMGFALIATWSNNGTLWNPVYQTNNVWTVYDSVKYSMGTKPFGTTDGIVGDITLPLRIPPK